MIYNNYHININRKFNKTNNKPQKVDISILEDKQQNFIDYLNYIIIYIYIILTAIVIFLMQLNII